MTHIFRWKTRVTSLKTVRRNPAWLYNMILYAGVRARRDDKPCRRGSVMETIEGEEKMIGKKAVNEREKKGFGEVSAWSPVINKPATGLTTVIERRAIDANGFIWQQYFFTLTWYSFFFSPLSYILLLLYCLFFSLSRLFEYTHYCYYRRRRSRRPFIAGRRGRVSTHCATTTTTTSCVRL